MRTRRRLLALSALALTIFCVVPAAATAATWFRPRIAGAMGLLPLPGQPRSAPAKPIPIVYHGGKVMHGARIHAIFWAPAGFRFSPAPAGSNLGYEQLVQQFLTDVAGASGATTNIFSVLGQYPDRHGAGAYRLSFDSTRDSIRDPTPYPAQGRTCVSRSGAGACVSDLQIQHEIDRTIRARDPSARGLHDIWLMFLPPDVDTCITAGSCATNAYAGYHSLLNTGPRAAIYAVVPDPLLALTPPAGADPQGNPEAEAALGTVAHELVEAVTDPQGAGWMDPNGLEVGDKCENGPQTGTPVGYAANGAPYNQIIGAHQYLVGTMWSASDASCRQGSASTASALPLPRVAMTQFSPVVSGSSGGAAGLPVTVLLARAGAVVARGLARTGSRGGWRTTLHSPAGVPVGVGDDREEILVSYGAHGPRPELIQTGDGGNPFTAAGWTGWFDLDHGFAVGRRSVLIGPCSQTGVITLRLDHAPVGSPLEQCGTSSDAATVPTPGLTSASSLMLTSEDNRAATATVPDGALVQLTVALGEPRATAAVENTELSFSPSGFPSCTANLRVQTVDCSGLVPGGRYALSRHRGGLRILASAGDAGTVAFPRLARAGGVLGGDRLTLRDHAGRTLTKLHVAHLRVDLTGSSTLIASGRCEPGEFYGPPLTKPPLGPGVGQPGVAGTGVICPLSGRAKGLPATHVVQQDDRGAGQTRTQVPLIEGTAPVHDATLYGPFRALAQAGLPGPHGTRVGVGARIAVTIRAAGSRRVAFHAANVNTPSGVAVQSLAPGSYAATWVLTDAAGDTRTIRTAFVEQR